MNQYKVSDFVNEYESAVTLADAEVEIEKAGTLVTSEIVKAQNKARADGTLWLNIGDSYAGSGRGMNGDGSPGKVGHLQAANRGANLNLVGQLPDNWKEPPPGYKAKDLMGIPWMLAFALRADGWYLRSDIIWAKPNPMPESVTDRPTKAHEYLFLLSKSARLKDGCDSRSNGRDRF